ncbi:unnamed protein product [Rotaria sp. Silwood1]|nr:unnamed protein product [Rotaria sp. Silwood1]CAF1581192.1 unnamed protein product [Rotaria sp. Silwood1]CAF1582211.1 unnamed protein product [Rotaria sp. Silwood1]CAF3757690.1 unnamed protein product [Rotaria sp. Silwood1]CAF3763760.1 unnamed protein product [Rotaria sp. Silwood1]
MSALSSEKHLLHTTDYNTSFNTNLYLKGVYSGVDIDPNKTPFAAFFLENTVQILHDEQKRLGNEKALEFGGGPSLWPSFLLAQYVDSIRFCYYTQANLDVVTDWIEKKPNAFDWTRFFEWVLDIVGNPKEKRIEWESRLRNALNQGGLSTCNVNDPHCPILSGKANDYDIIFSSLCLEAACLTIEIFDETIKRLVRLLKPGGLLLLAMVRNNSYYYVNGEKFFCLPLDEKKVEKALRATGELVDIHIDSWNATIDDKQRNTISELDGKMVIRAHKTI